MFSHHIMFIGAFIAWVTHLSILFTFILRRCNAFIISVIVVIRRSIIFTEHFLWHLITVGKFSIHAQLVSSMWCCPNGHISIYKPWLTRLSFVHHSLTYGGREARTNFFTCRDTLGPLFAFWIKVYGDGHHWLLCRSCYTTCMCSFQLAIDRTL